MTYTPMTNLVAPSLALGLLTFCGATMAQLNSETPIPLGEALAVGSVVFFIGRKLQKLEDKLDKLEAELKSRPCQSGSCSAKDSIKS